MTCLLMAYVLFYTWININYDLQELKHLNRKPKFQQEPVNTRQSEMFVAAPLN